MSRRRARRRTNRGGSEQQSATRSDERSGGRKAGGSGSGSGGSGGGSGGGGGGKGRGRRRRNRNGGGSRSNRRSGAAFWGDTDRLPDARPDVVITDDPDAVPRSLGLPPLPGREKLLAHYLDAVYDRAVQNAGALAAVSGLIEADDLAERSDDDAA